MSRQSTVDSRQLALVLFAVFASCKPAPSPTTPVESVSGASVCAEIRWSKQDYMERTGFNYGDSWMMTWGPDGRTYTNFSDGKLTAGGPKPTNAILVIADDPPELTAASFVPISSDPLRFKSSWSHYIISTLFVGDTLYVGHVNLAVGAEMASGIARSDDFGKTLSYDRERPMWPARPSGPRFVYPSFLQNGRAYGGNTDGFVYVYGSDGEWGKKNTLRLARVETDRVMDAGAYRYWAGDFAGRGRASRPPAKSDSNDDRWVPDLDRARDVLVDGDGSNLGGMQSIVYNPPLRRYFLVTFGDAFNDRARMVLYDAPEPWGPWHHCGQITADQALFRPGELFTKLYNPSFNAKWIEPDGSMWISYSNYTPQYSFHYGKIEIVSQ